MQVQFLLGPAGSGKTFRCLAEIRAALKESPEGPPLILLAPRQATFQLERQLLATGELPGYTRLHIVSFDRLARFILGKLSVPLPDQVNDEGRIMVLRALLFRRGQELKRFGQSACRPGFARQLGQLFADLQRHQFTPSKLHTLTDRFLEYPELRDKLSDLALLLEAYNDWLVERKLQDANDLLDLASTNLRRQKTGSRSIHFGGLWLDGFAEMTPQELGLLSAVLSHSDQSTLAFCLDRDPDDPPSALSMWSAVGRTYQQCRQRVENVPECKVHIESLRRDPRKSRFHLAPQLRFLEEHWERPRRTASAIHNLQPAITLTACTNSEAEAVFAAREILRSVRTGNRFRDCGVIVRDLEAYHKPLARVFRRYGIPFFLDRRESVAHHPLAELTRNALRTVVLDWQHDDWFAALKAGFSPVHESEIDQFENAALEFGWRGPKWRQPEQSPGGPGSMDWFGKLGKKILPPFEKFAARLGQHQGGPTGSRLADAVRELWDALSVEETLRNWSLPDNETAADAADHSLLHSTVWDQMNSWLDNVALAFPKEHLSLREWLPIVEAGLSNLTVGVVPPALDQVLIGAVDRARNPDLKVAFVLGVNEGVFPAASPALTILTQADCDELEQRGASLGLNLRERLARERYLCYIACTRAGEKLVLTCSRQNAAGKTLNPSSLMTHLQTLFPALALSEFRHDPDWREAQHRIEMVAPLAEIGRHGDESIPENWRHFIQLPPLANLRKCLDTLAEPDPGENISPELAEALYGPALQTSVSGLEEFAQCPFRFFIHSGLRAEERKQFELDARERGSFQHEVLKVFHEQLKAEHKHWRDLTPAQARERIRDIAATLAPDYRDGLLRADDRSRFAARMLSESLQDFVETLVAWMHRQYEFDPAAVEFGFGFGAGGAPAWTIDLGKGHQLALRGRIDRIDLWRDADGSALCVVMDYKSGQRRLDRILIEHGVQLQLLGYLAAMTQWPNVKALWNVDRLIPAGVFYANLRGAYNASETRAEALADADEARRRAYRHTGRFSLEALPKLDSRSGIESGDQFSFRRTQGGSLHKGSVEALPHAEFEALLHRVEAQLIQMGRAIFEGMASVDPYQKGADNACQYCDYGGVCRIDRGTHRFRVLRAAPKEAGT